MSKRNGEQCKKLALRGKAVCDFHGGRSTGPKTAEGKARQRAAVIKSGNYTKEALEDRARSVRVLAGLEGAMYVLNMTNIPRSRGLKPLSYVPLTTVEDVMKFALDNPLHSPRRIAVSTANSTNNFIHGLTLRVGRGVRASSMRSISASFTVRLRPCGVGGFRTSRTGLSMLMPHSRRAWLIKLEIYASSRMTVPPDTSFRR